jgi:hypothetical protein
METAEGIARARNCIEAWVDTYTFQSPSFYERFGYRTSAGGADIPFDLSDR